MSADNWAICPRCKEKHADEAAKRIEKVNKQYGEIDQDEFIKLRQAAIDFAGEKLGATLREDYDLGIDSQGYFSVSYSGHCGKCEFGHKFKHEEKLKM